MESKHQTDKYNLPPVSCSKIPLIDLQSAGKNQWWAGEIEKRDGERERARDGERERERQRKSEMREKERDERERASERERE